tara:strand:- start:1736 stop:2614 length:879 start_codon:yes stop_codon:yes gene_type:complete
MKSVPRQIREYLNEPYPFYYENKKRLFSLLLVISFLSFIFSYFFEPFDVNETEHKISSVWILLIHAFTPFPIAYLYLTLVNRNKQDDVSWTLGKEVFHLSIILLIIGVVGFLIRDLIYTNPDNWSFRYFWEEIRNTFLIGFLLLVVVLPLNLERLIYKYNLSSKKLPSITEHRTNSLLIPIQGPISDEGIQLKIEDFLFAKVEGNYTEIFTSSSNVTNKTLIRITLKELEEQLEPVSHQIYKTHRSYLVNLNAIESISGNAQGYRLVFKNCSTIVPVSRSRIVEFNSVYSHL